jgi:hypothetical protein
MPARTYQLLQYLVFFAIMSSECSHCSLQPWGRPMKTLAGVNVLDLYEATGARAYSVDGVHAEFATANKPRHDDLSHDS